LVSGIGEVMRFARLEEAMRGADWVVTGEGRLDEQSLHGKVVSGVLEMARRMGARVAVIAGACEVSEAVCRERGVSVALSANEKGLPLEEALARAEEFARDAGARLGGRMTTFPGK